MNDPTSTLGQSRRGTVAATRGVMATATKRCACALVLVLLFLTLEVDGMPGHESEARASLPPGSTLFEHGLALQIMGDHAWADTSADAERGRYEGPLSTRARHKTH